MEELKQILSTALISDILDEEGYKDQMLPIEIKPNFNEAKMFGRARIMTLKSIEPSENYSEVYKGLYFLESLNKGDILIVGNAFSDYSFFGELMSTLAKLKGVEGTLIDGCTRDKAETIKLEYPVFARNNIARDIKKRGVVDQTDLNSVKIDKTLIRKGDYLLGDLDGVIVIPFEMKDKIIEKAIRAYNSEKKIKECMKKGMDVKNLLKNWGEF